MRIQAGTHPIRAGLALVSKEHGQALGRLQTRKCGRHEMVVGIGAAKALIGIQTADGWPQWNCLHGMVDGCRESRSLPLVMERRNVPLAQHEGSMPEVCHGQRDATGERQRLPCQDSVVLQRTSCVTRKCHQGRVLQRMLCITDPV